MPEFRSKFEKVIADGLASERISFFYEKETFSLALPATRGHKCERCQSKSITQTTRYTPDLTFPKNPLVVEIKGRFTGRDRKKALAFISQYPERKYGLLFMYDNRLSKASKTRYSDWCKANSVPYEIGFFKKEWLR